ncbi:MAG TPA: hypothetical protein VII23_08605 [Terriglobales bacterium]
MSEELAQAMNQQLQMFRKKFGRDPGPEDPIFFDPDADTPVPMPLEKIGAGWNEVLQKAGELGMDPAIIYAMRKTGRMVTEQNMQYLEPEELQEWEDAVEDYHSLVKSGKLQ